MNFFLKATIDTHSICFFYLSFIFIKYLFILIVIVLFC
jgi:hypothetical protein